MIFHACGESIASMGARTSGSTPTGSTPTRFRPAHSAATGSASSCSPSIPPSTSWPESPGPTRSSSAPATWSVRRRDALDRGRPEDGEIGSYGLDQCLDAVREALVRRVGPGPGRRHGWSGRASRSRCSTRRRPAATGRMRRYPSCPMAAIACASARPSSATGPRPSISSSPRPRSATTRPDRRRPGRHRRGRQHDTGAYGSTGTVIAGAAVLRPRSDSPTCARRDRT